MPAHVLGQMRTTDLLLALDEELNVQRQSASLRDRRRKHRDNEEDRSLIIGDTAAASDVAVDGEPERRR